MKVNVDGDTGGSPSSTTETVTVAVAVKSAEGKSSQRAVKWAVEKLLAKAHRFVLIHVMPTITTIPTPSGESTFVNELEANVVKLYMEDKRAQCEEIFIPFKIFCKRKNVETLVLEGNNPATVLLKYVNDSGIKSLVLGSYSPNYFSRKLKGSSVPSIVLKHAPECCDVYVVSSNKLMTNSLNPLLATEGDLPTINKQKSSASSASIDAVYHSRSSSLASSHLNFPAFVDGNSSNYVTPQHRPNRNLENVTTGLEAVKGCHSSTYSEQLDIQEEVERVRLELQTTLAMYNQTCEDLIHTRNKVQLFSSQYLEESGKVNAAKKREENLRKIAAEEKEKHIEAEKEVETARKLLSEETYERQIAELKALQQSLEKKKTVDALLSSDDRYRRLTREEIAIATDNFSKSKIIGEGAYGKVYKGDLDHTPVAIKVLCSDASEKKEEFLREVEVLSQLHHPHIVLLLGACPENGCLVYEYMENRNLEDCILERNSKLFPWFSRFRILFEVACALAFLHNSKPEPIVHRDLKPGNILLDKNFVSKIGDVGLAKIISDVVPESVTEYRNSVLAGTLSYMDPEYQRTGTLRPKSDLYAFGIITLQLLAACRPNGLIMMFEDAINSNSLIDILDKSVPDWPLIEAEELARMALKCCNLRCRDRPDLETEVLPLLKRLSDFADMHTKVEKNLIQAPNPYLCPIVQEVMEDPQIAADGFTYEHRAIKLWLTRHSVSPVTKQLLQHKLVTPNRTLRLAIQEWRSQVMSFRTRS
ncbi:U-box domain-containing protein 34 isoform X1 [Nicotiana tomentosiformis]|uniref:U-box domain-containing protein 34 isoform X1 n=2 Tax=Nicotiana tomentosiformis TaxID=4098 RepID=UPI00051B4D37|nr:U-box domain-containing protein 34-like isoform X1 [Nicotiana tomentosiformis]